MNRKVIPNSGIGVVAVDACAVPHVVASSSRSRVLSRVLLHRLSDIWDLNRKEWINTFDIWKV